MMLIVGLGNPGGEYEETRHNFGFMLIERLLARAGGRRFRDATGAKVAEVTLVGKRVLLVKPQTYMNLSGDAVKPLLARYGDGDLSNLIVAADDVALPFGMIRVRAGGSAGGQKGLKSVIERLGSDRFTRLRLGVKPDHPVGDLASFVLAVIPKRDRARLDETLDRAADAIEVILTEGVERAQARFNERVKDVTSDE
jgi:peptidyl-tRNA hydrolase, PTH1 family